MNQSAERERMFDYKIIQRNNYEEKEVGRQKFKRQHTTTSQVEDDDIREIDDDNPFTTVSRGFKRKQRRLSNKGKNDDEIILDVDHATTKAGNGERPFINSRSRTNKSFNNGDTETNHAARYRDTTRKERQINTTTDDDSNASKSSVAHRINLNENENRNDNEKVNNEGVKNESISISKHTLQYAMEHHLPSLCIECQPKIENYDKAKEIVKLLFTHIEKNFRQFYKNYRFPVGFDYWYINKDGDLACYKRHTELFVYLADLSNYPSIINNINMIPCRPKHLPFQNTIVLKFVSNHISQDDIQREFEESFISMYNIEEMKGSRTDKFSHVRLELKTNE